MRGYRSFYCIYKNLKGGRGGGGSVIYSFFWRGERDFVKSQGTLGQFTLK